jgi:hypothetical protein
MSCVLHNVGPNTRLGMTSGGKGYKSDCLL